jgi:transposase
MLKGLSQRTVAARFGIDRATVAKMISSPTPPGYRRKTPVRRPKLADHEAFIDQILDEDTMAPAKQRHTAQRIFERLRDERGFDGGYSTVRDFVRARRQVRKEVFVPLAHPPGHAQADFGEATVVLGGSEQKIRFFVMDLPQSDAVFVKAYHSETAEAFCDGHVEAFVFFGGVPLSILYDNTRLAVAQILGDGTRKRSHLFAAMQCHYVFEDRYGRPAKGNDKGAVEGMVGFTRRTFMVPLPHARDIDELNAMLRERCEARQQAVLRGESDTIADRLGKDRAAFMDLPAVAFDACDQRPGRVSSQALVRYRNNDYSVPVTYAHREIIVKGYVDEVIVVSGGDEIARHRRSYETADFVFDPLHYLPLLEQKVGALDQAAPLQGWDLPSEFSTLRRLLEARLSQKNRCAAGKREFVQVLRLMESFPITVVHAAVKDALRLGAISSDAVRHLILARIEGRPARLDADRYPHLPVVTVGTTRPADYMTLMGAP